METPGLAIFSVGDWDREKGTDGEASLWDSIHAPVYSVLLNWDHHGEEGHRDRTSPVCGAAAPILGRNPCPVLPSEPSHCSCPVVSIRAALRAQFCAPLRLGTCSSLALENWSRRERLDVN